MEIISIDDIPSQRETIIQKNELEIQDSVFNPFESVTDELEYFSAASSGEINLSYNEFTENAYFHMFKIDSSLQI